MHALAGLRGARFTSEKPGISIRRQAVSLAAARDLRNVLRGASSLFLRSSIWVSHLTTAR